jgi:hypothetical protein
VCTFRDISFWTKILSTSAGLKLLLSTNAYGVTTMTNKLQTGPTVLQREVLWQARNLFVNAVTEAALLADVHEAHAPLFPEIMIGKQLTFI